MDEIHSTLSERKEAFLNSVQEEIRKYIVSTRQQCIAIVERSPSGGVYRTWNVHLDNNLGHFCKVLYKFTRRQQYNGHDLDSALTDPISERVEAAYQKFYESEREAIANAMLKMLAADEVKLQGFMDRLSAIVLDSFSMQMRKQVVDMLKQQVKHSVDQASSNVIGTHISHFAASTAASHVAVTATHLLMHLLAAHMSKIVSKVLASALLKKILAVVVKKFVLAAVTTAVTQFLATHVSAAAGGSSVMFIVLPLLVAYIGYRIATFPEKLGEKVSHKIRSELNDRFIYINQSILEKVFDAVFSGNEIVDAIAKEKGLREKLQQLGTTIKSRAAQTRMKG